MYNVCAKQTWQEKSMDKKEILAENQKAGKGMDLADLDAQKKGTYLSYFLMAFLLLVFMGVNWIFFKRISYELLVILCTGAGAAFFYKFAMLRKKHELVVGIIWTVLALLSLTSYILQLSGVLKF